MNIGSYVKVKDQDITGFIVENYGNKMVIEDDCSEYAAPDNRLEYFVSDLELVEELEFIRSHFQFIHVGG